MLASQEVAAAVLMPFSIVALIVSILWYRKAWAQYRRVRVEFATEPAVVYSYLQTARWAFVGIVLSCAGTFTLTLVLTDAL